MTKLYFPDEQITTDDLYFVCYMTERIARRLKQPNSYVINAMGHDGLVKKLSLADVLHSANPFSIETDWIDEYHLTEGNYDVSRVSPELCEHIPTASQMGKVYKRLILNTLKANEDYADGMIRVYNDPICKTLDKYDCGAYYEPSPYIARSYMAGGF